jgi:hypothetical protein
MMKPDPRPKDPSDDRRSPAIWLYPKEEIDVEVRLQFHGTGFMTSSIPSYNDTWRIHVDPKPPFNRYSSTYVDDPWVPYLDYDGFRDGEFQRAAGWCIHQKDLLNWQRSHLKEIGFTDAEIDDVNYSYGRMLLERQYKEEFFAIYPQDAAIVDTSVSLTVFPRPDSIYRLWLYFVPMTARAVDLRVPHVKKVERHGFSVIELAYLTDREIPSSGLQQTAQPGRRTMLGHRAGVECRK